MKPMKLAGSACLTSAAAWALFVTKSSHHYDKLAYSFFLSSGVAGILASISDDDQVEKHAEKGSTRSHMFGTSLISTEICLAAGFDNVLSFSNLLLPVVHTAKFSVPREQEEPIKQVNEVQIFQLNYSTANIYENFAIADNIMGHHNTYIHHIGPDNTVQLLMLLGRGLRWPTIFSRNMAAASSVRLEASKRLHRERILDTSIWYSTVLLACASHSFDLHVGYLLTLTLAVGQPKVSRLYPFLMVLGVILARETILQINKIVQ